MSILRWYRTWRSKTSHVLATEMEKPCKMASLKCFRKSRARKPAHLRQRDFGGGRRHKAILIRQELYEWFTSIRYAIDWKQLITDRRSRGKKHLARFPRSANIFQSPSTSRRSRLLSIVERRACGVICAKFTLVERLVGGLWIIHAQGAQEISSTQICAQRAPRKLLGQFVQTALFHPTCFWIRSDADKFRSIAISSQRNRFARPPYLGTSN